MFPNVYTYVPGYRILLVTCTECNNTTGMETLQVEIEVPRGTQNIQNGLIQFLQEVDLEGYECAR